MTHDKYELSILVNGRPIREYGHRGLTYVEGRKDQTYSIRFRNNSSLRILAIVSVDGIGIVDGKPATVESRGYVVPAYSSAEFKGWRKSLEKVHDFVFDHKSGSYSAQAQGTDQNCGIVEVKVFGENIVASIQKLVNEMNQKDETKWHIYHHHYPYVQPTPPSLPPWGYPIITCGSSMAEESMSRSVSQPTYSNEVYNGPSMTSTLSHSQPESSAQEMLTCANTSLMPNEPSEPVQEHADFNLGTAWGDERHEVVTEVDFLRGIELATLSIYYSDEEGLKKAGIDVCKDVAVAKATLPQGFNGFCTPPPAIKR